MSDDVKGINVNGIKASDATIKDGSYKLQRPFIFITQGEPQGIVKDFIDWSLGPEGQKIIEKEKIVPVNNS
jgi:phosphate transport system substrate-binding protein